MTLVSHSLASYHRNRIRSGSVYSCTRWRRRWQDKMGHGTSVNNISQLDNCERQLVWNTEYGYGVVVQIPNGPLVFKSWLFWSIQKRWDKSTKNVYYCQSWFETGSRVAGRDIQNPIVTSIHGLGRIVVFPQAIHVSVVSDGQRFACEVFSDLHQRSLGLDTATGEND